MKEKYRINWKSGMRLSDKVFNAADEYHISRLSPIYEYLLRGGFGHLQQPKFRCDVDNHQMTVMEMSVRALTSGGELLFIDHNQDDGERFKELAMPGSTEPFIVYLECSDEDIESFEKDGIPFRDKRYTIAFHAEGARFMSRNAVALARFEYKQCWMQDLSFIPPTLTLQANADLWNKAHLYLKTLKDLITALKEKGRAGLKELALPLLPTLTDAMLEIEKEVDELGPRNLVTLMQRVIGVVMDMCVIDGRIELRDPQDCASFIAAAFSPIKIGSLVAEGIRLTQMILTCVESTRIFSPAPVNEPIDLPAERKPRVPGPVDTTGERKSFRNRR